MSALNIFFFRGLSTVGSDNARFSRLDFGPIHAHYQKAFEERGARFFPVLGMGRGTLLEVASKARKLLEEHPVWQDPYQPVHFLGHSAGGLVARLVLKDLADKAQGKVGSLFTIATPHAGSLLASMVVAMPEMHRRSTWILRTIGFNLRAKKALFEDLTPEGVRRALPLGDSIPPKVRTGSLVCWAPRSEWCRPLRMAHKLPALRAFDMPSDGLVERDSQPFGDVYGEIQLDHFRQVGLFGETDRFLQSCDLAMDFFKNPRF